MHRTEMLPRTLGSCILLLNDIMFVATSRGTATSSVLFPVTIIR